MDVTKVQNLSLGELSLLEKARVYAIRAHTHQTCSIVQRPSRKGERQLATQTSATSLMIRKESQRVND